MKATTFLTKTGGVLQKTKALMDPLTSEVLSVDKTRQEMQVLAAEEIERYAVEIELPTAPIDKIQAIDRICRKMETFASELPEMSGAFDAIVLRMEGSLQDIESEISAELSQLISADGVTQSVESYQKKAQTIIKTGEQYLSDLTSKSERISLLKEYIESAIQGELDQLHEQVKLGYSQILS